jgi:uncharacterized membrane protein
MIHFENELMIERPVEQVFNFVADLENLPKWNYFVEDVSRTSNNGSSRGSTFHQIRKEDEQDLKILEYIQNQLLVVETIPPSQPELHREIIFEDKAPSTVITDRWELKLGVPKILEPLAVLRVQAAVRANLQKLKTLLETGQVTLQDGRPISLQT